ncbi:MAG: DUF4339 domain-containing protein [Bacteroidetes bacterium]|nr:DUF4339 domain-containing protein [Bacteroidota bacterium]
MRKYFVHKFGKEQGPFTLQELIAFGIDPASMVWYEGLSDWMPAGKIAELAPAFPATPPPLKGFTLHPSNTPTTKSAGSTHLTPGQDSLLRARRRSRNRRLTIGGILTLLLAAIAWGGWWYSQQSKALSQVSQPAADSETKPAATPVRPLNPNEVSGKFIFKSRGDKVNVRLKPEMNAAVLCQLSNEEQVVFENERTSQKSTVNVKGVDHTNYWYKIQPMHHAGIIGWVHGDFLTFPADFPQ